MTQYIQSIGWVTLTRSIANIVFGQDQLLYNQQPVTSPPLPLLTVKRQITDLENRKITLVIDSAYNTRYLQWMACTLQNFPPYQTSLKGMSFKYFCLYIGIIIYESYSSF